jgi:hypothetical protein
MLLSLFAPRTTRRTPSPKPPPVSFFRPRLEGFEDRVVPAAPLGLPRAAHVAFAQAGQQSVLPISIDAVQAVNGALQAVGSVGGTAFTAPLTLTGSPAASNNGCPILNLSLGPIHLNLLGLNVVTSPICLDITAHSGQGNLLGNLLCDVAGLLNNGSTLSGILGGLSGSQLSTLTSGLTNLLGDTFGALGSRAAVQGVSGSAAGATDILNLSLGPVDLNLLGLEVSLDNCSGGPVTLDITAQPGAGNLLGNLLTGLANLLNRPPANPNLVGQLLDQVVGEIGNLLHL